MKIIHQNGLYVQIDFSFRIIIITDDQLIKIINKLIRKYINRLNVLITARYFSQKACHIRHGDKCAHPRNCQQSLHKE